MVPTKQEFLRINQIKLIKKITHHKGLPINHSSRGGGLESESVTGNGRGYHFYRHRQLFRLKIIHWLIDDDDYDDHHNNNNNDNKCKNES